MQNRNMCTSREGLGPRVSPSDVALVASCHVNTKNCVNCLLNENYNTEGQSAKVYSF